HLGRRVHGAARGEIGESRAGLVTADERYVSVEEFRHLRGDRGEHIAWRGTRRHYGGDAAQRRLISSGHVVGHVSGNSGHKTAGIGSGPATPLQPAHGTVAADVPVLELV